MTELSLEHVLVASLAVLLIAFVKGAYGGGFGLVGIPMLSLVMDPIRPARSSPRCSSRWTSSLRYFPPRTWSKPDLKVLIPADGGRHRDRRGELSVLDLRLVSIAIAVVALAFAAHWYAGGQRIDDRAAQDLARRVAGTIRHRLDGRPSGARRSRCICSGWARQGGLRRHQHDLFHDRQPDQGWPWLYARQPTRAMWILIAISTPVAIICVWLGWLLHTAPRSAADLSGLLWDPRAGLAQAAVGRGADTCERAPTNAFYFPDTPDLPLPPGHRFPRGKYRLLRAKLERDGVLDGGNARALALAAQRRYLRAHDGDYIEAVMTGALTTKLSG